MQIAHARAHTHHTHARARAHLLLGLVFLPLFGRVLSGVLIGAIGEGVGMQRHGVSISIR